MLSRVADAFYWMSRYLERAEHAARVIDVASGLALDASSDTVGGQLLLSIETPPLADGDSAARNVRLGDITPAQIAAVSANVARARENARQIREQISAEMWEHLNSIYLLLNRSGGPPSDPGTFARMMINRAHLFHGVAEASLSRGEGWHFMEIGRYIERAITTSMMLKRYFIARDRRPTGDRTGDVKDEAAGTGLLSACAALEAYCRQYTAEIRRERVAEFLLLNADFPRSARFAADRIEDSLRTVARLAGRQATGRPERFAGRLRASLNYGTVDEVLEDGVNYLEQLHRQCGQIHVAIYQTYITYPIESAIGR